MVDLQVRRLGRTKMKPKAFGLGGGYLGFPELTSEEEATTEIAETVWQDFEAAFGIRI